MSYLGSQSYSGILIPNQIFKGQIYKIPNGYLSLLVSVKLQEEGYLTIYSSNDGQDFSPFDQTLIQAPFKSVVYPLRGLYFYLQYENFVVEDNIQLLCRISEFLPDGLFQDMSVNVENQPPFLFDASGNLKVSGSGGGTTSDVTVLNQITNYALETTQQDILTELEKFTFNASFNSNQAMWVAVDSIPNGVNVNNFPSVQTVDVSGVVDVSGSISVNNFPQVQEVSGNITVNTISGFALESSLLKVVNNKGDVEGEIYFSSGAPVWADTNPTPTQNTKSLQGWNYVNTGGDPKSMNFYYYDGTNETDKTLGDVKGQYCVITNNSTKYINKMILVTYTVGSLNVWYQSRVSHSNYNSKMAPGMQYLLYWGDVDSDIYPNLPRINLSNTTTTGTGLPSELILTLSLASDSQSASGDINITCDSLGVVFTGGVSRTYKLMNNENEYTLLTSIKTDLDKNTYDSNNLLVKVSNFPSTQPVSGSVSVSNFPTLQTVDISGNVNIGNFPSTQAVSGSVSVDNFPSLQTVDVSGNINIGNFPTTQPVSGSVSVSNFPSTQPVSGSVSVSNFPTLQTVDVSGNVNIGNFPSTQPVSGSVSVSNFPSTQAVSGSVSVSNFPTLQTVDVSGNVNIGNFPSTQPVSGSVSVSNFPTSSQVENKTGTNLRTDLYADNGSAQEKLTSSGGQLKVYNMDAKISEVISAQTTSNSYLNNIQTDLDKNNYDASGNLKTNVQNTSLDVHCYGSSDGSTWHHIKTNTTGVVSTNAVLETDANGALTSTVSSGSYNALDVSIKNPSLSVAVSNSVNVASTSSGTWGNSLNNGTINGNQGSTGFNISSFAYIYGIYRDSNTNNNDSLRVEYSFDNSTWYYLGDQLYPSMPQGEQYRQGQIYDKRKYSWNYVRIFNPNNYALNNVYLTILGSSI